MGSHTARRRRPFRMPWQVECQCASGEVDGLVEAANSSELIVPGGDRTSGEANGLVKRLPYGEENCDGDQRDRSVPVPRWVEF